MTTHPTRSTSPHESIFSLFAIAAAVIGIGISAVDARAECPAVHVVAALDGAPAGAIDDVVAALAEMERRTGIDFVLAPADERVDLVIAWGAIPVSATEPPLLARARKTPSGFGGVIEFNPHTPLPAGDRTDRRTWFGVTLHELGHIVGLHHSSDSDSLMYPRIVGGGGLWTNAEIRSLGEVGRQAGCGSGRSDATKFTLRADDRGVASGRAGSGPRTDRHRR